MITDIKPKHVKHFYMIHCYKCEKVIQSYRSRQDICFLANCEKVIQSYRSRQDICFLANKIFGWKYDTETKMVLCDKCFLKIQEGKNVD